MFVCVVALFDNEENDVKPKRIDHFFNQLVFWGDELEKIRHRLPIAPLAIDLVFGCQRAFRRVIQVGTGALVDVG
jgi:hypothetical protein